MKLAELFVAGVLASSMGFAAVRSSPSRSSSSSARSSSTYHSTPTPRPASRPSWSSTKSYGTGSSSKVGNSALKSKTPVPQPHTYQGKKYNSSNAIYTNKKGRWVYYWIPVGTVIYCYDQDHKRLDCDRDDKAYQRSW